MEEGVAIVPFVSARVLGGVRTILKAGEPYVVEGVVAAWDPGGVAMGDCITETPSGMSFLEALDSRPLEGRLRRGSGECRCSEELTCDLLSVGVIVRKDGKL